jgi:hypothetical protein
MNYPRTNYEMTAADLERILDACKPTIAIKIGNYTGGNPQENANAAWAELGSRMGFDYMTVQPLSGKGNRFFSAVPSENETQHKERLAREVKEATAKQVAQLEQEISEREQLLHDLRTNHPA